MKYLFVLLTFVISTITSSHGSEQALLIKDAARIAAATELVDAMNLKAQFEASFQASQSLMSGTGDPESLFEKQVSPDIWKNTKPTVVQSYAETFTTDELNKLIKIFKTPEGQILAQKQDILVKSYLKVAAMNLEKSLSILEEDKNVKLPDPASHSPKENDLLLTIVKPAEGNQHIYKIGDHLLSVSEKTPPRLQQSGKLLVEFLKEEKLKKTNLRVLIKADRNISAKELSSALQWCAEAGIDSIAFSGASAK